MAEIKPEHMAEIKPEHMAEMKKVVAAQDDSSHWYVIPAELLTEFSSLSQAGSNPEFTDGEKDELEKIFMEKFGEYRTGGDLNNVQLYAEI